MRKAASFLLLLAGVLPAQNYDVVVYRALSLTDYGKKEVIGGYSLEFYARAGAHYDMRQYGHDVAWYHEPHVAEKIYGDMAGCVHCRPHPQQPRRRGHQHGAPASDS